MREVKNHQQEKNITIITAADNIPMAAKISGRKFEEKQCITIVSNYLP